MMEVCPYDCGNKTEFGYCKTSACINPSYRGKWYGDWNFTPEMLEKPVYTKQKMKECIRTFGDTFLNNAEEIACLAMKEGSRTTRVQLICTMSVEEIPNIRIEIEQYPQRIILPWEYGRKELTE